MPDTQINLQHNKDLKSLYDEGKVELEGEWAYSLNGKHGIDGSQCLGSYQTRCNRT